MRPTNMTFRIGKVGSMPLLWTQILRKRIIKTLGWLALYGRDDSRNLKVCSKLTGGSDVGSDSKSNPGRMLSGALFTYVSSYCTNVSKHYL